MHEHYAFLFRIRAEYLPVPYSFWAGINYIFWPSLFLRTTTMFFCLGSGCINYLIPSTSVIISDQETYITWEELGKGKERKKVNVKKERKESLRKMEGKIRWKRKYVSIENVVMLEMKERQRYFFWHDFKRQCVNDWNAGRNEKVYKLQYIKILHWEIEQKKGKNRTQ